MPPRTPRRKRTPRKPRTPRTPRLTKAKSKKRLVLCKCLCALTALLLLPGCARFSTTQADIRYENGKPATTITTKASSYTLFSSKSQLANFSAAQTEKTQGAKVGSLSQQGGTNTVLVLQELARILTIISAAAATP